MAAHLFNVMKQIITPKKLSHIMSDNLLIGDSISDWDPIENRIWCMLMHSSSPMAHTSFNITMVHRYTHVGNPDEDEEDILELISGMDEPMCCHDVGIQELELIAYAVTHWGSWQVQVDGVRAGTGIDLWNPQDIYNDGMLKPQKGTPMYHQYTLVESTMTNALINLILDPCVKDLYIKEEWDEDWAENAPQKFQEEFDKYKLKYNTKKQNTATPPPIVQPESMASISYGNVQHMNAVLACWAKEAMESGNQPKPWVCTEKGGGSGAVAPKKPQGS
ncbi:hypothetical protein BS47DRAFT_1357666 [Hydnum rufescens UP504]|uniref:Uncharacterized protein n=1 Tax=Hydnum rufescens UP504 TaxID=1448309 RepID=A0A9P6B9D8_9AGAM|nr:hypothetical protein BS47DRAFT_1357666 [Hydnum rufescens UP504]